MATARLGVAAKGHWVRLVAIVPRPPFRPMALLLLLGSARLAAASEAVDTSHPQRGKGGGVGTGSDGSSGSGVYPVLCHWQISMGSVPAMNDSEITFGQ